MKWTSNINLGYNYYRSATVADIISVRESTDMILVEARRGEAAMCVHSVETSKVKLRLLYCKGPDSDSSDVTHKFLARSGVR